jgi:hypothetical protein
MKTEALRHEKLLWLATPVGVALWRLIEWWQLNFSASWAYYLGEPLPFFALVVLLLCAAGLALPLTSGSLRASVFIWLAVIYGLLPTQGGSMAAHPDYFLEEAIDRVSEKLYRARQSGQLPTHAVDLRRMLQPDGSLHYRRGETRSVPIELRIHARAAGPVLEPGDRPGVIHMAIETGSKKIWITGSSLGFSRFGAPVILPDRQGAGPAIIEVHGASTASDNKGKPKP